MNKNISVIFWAWISVIILFSSCSENEKTDFYTADFTYEIDSSNPNKINLTNTSEGDYLYLQWDLGKGEGAGRKDTDKTTVRSVHYPNKGTYEISLTVWGPTNKPADTKVISKTITIAQDDPDFDGDKETLIWSDEFDGTEINQNTWTFETGSGGWGNNELQNYTNGDNARISDGKLIITAQKVNDSKAPGSYTSTRMISWGKKEFTYGRIEVRAKLPSGKGIWPAIWMLGANLSEVSWPACGEIDIMEYVGYQPNVVHATVHTPAGYGGNGNGKSKALDTAEEEFHIYGLLWNKDELVFYIDTPDNVTHTYAPAVKNASNWPFDKPHFFILNVAVGGTWGGAQGIDNSIFPQTMEVDYVRVYKLPN
ncbi:Glycosyl hydrolases family 16 [Saccharicrinis carchari]|uniref:Glycosyl hydrolases family 16 n=1 Tax=Saccharicrinis carchari TaxID=1168039 RepID=A0A521BA28_SACCC|nr:glycoside hydrolase family 16 protein [Saccharicrinis carchari]SMO43927.1 Glycosyl hydrolases family 16 [Saccharicrinis carchari]